MVRETTGQCGSVLLFPVVSGLFLQKKKKRKKKSLYLLKKFCLTELLLTLRATHLYFLYLLST